MEDYIILTSYEGKLDLVKQVNLYLKEGYSLVGGVAVGISNGNDFSRYKSIVYAQAMVKNNYDILNEKGEK